MISSRKLNIREMWQLYGYLKNGIEEKQKEYLIDELSAIMEKITQEEYLKSISLLYNDKIEYAKLLPIDSIILFMDGLNFNKFFDFCNLIRDFANDHAK